MRLEKKEMAVTSVWPKGYEKDKHGWKPEGREGD